MTALVTVAGVPFDQAFALVMIGVLAGAVLAATAVYAAWQRDLDRRVFGPRPGNRPGPRPDSSGP